MSLTEDHLLLLEKHTAGTQYRRVLAELRHRGIDAERQRQMFEEIAEVIGRAFLRLKAPSPDSQQETRMKTRSAQALNWGERSAATNAPPAGQAMFTSLKAGDHPTEHVAERLPATGEQRPTRSTPAPTTSRHGTSDQHSTARQPPAKESKCDDCKFNDSSACNHGLHEFQSEESHGHLPSVMTYQPHMTMKAILDKEESRKSSQRNKSRSASAPKQRTTLTCSSLC